MLNEANCQKKCPSIFISSFKAMLQGFFIISNSIVFDAGGPQKFSVNTRTLGIKAAGHDCPEILVALAHHLDGDARGVIFRIAVHAGADAREGDAADPGFLRQPDRAAVAALQQLRLALITAMPHRAHRVDHPFGFEAKSRCDARFTGGTTTQLAAGFQQSRPRRPMYRPVHATAAQERGVGRVDDDIHVQIGDVVLDDLDHRQSSPVFRHPSPQHAALDRFLDRKSVV